MSENCPIYKQLLQNWKTSLQRVEALRDKFQETEDLRLKQKFEELWEELEINKKAFFDFAYEEVESGNNIVSPRIDFDVGQIVKNLELDENTTWEIIEIISKIPGIKTDLTNIKQEYKDRIENWEGSIKDYSQEVSYSSLKTVGKSLDAEKAETFSAPSLETVGVYLDAQNATTFSADSLRNMGGDLYAQSAETFSAKSLEVVWGLNVQSATIFLVPQLKRARKIYLTKKNFSEFWEIKKFFKFWGKNGNFNWDRAYSEGRLVIDEKIRDKVEWS